MNALDRVDVRVGTTADLGSVVTPRTRRCVILLLLADAMQLTYIEFQEFRPTDEEDEDEDEEAFQVLRLTNEEDGEKSTTSEVRYKCSILLHH